MSTSENTPFNGVASSTIVRATIVQASTVYNDTPATLGNLLIIFILGRSSLRNVLHEFCFQKRRTSLLWRLQARDRSWLCSRRRLSVVILEVLGLV